MNTYALSQDILEAIVDNTRPSVTVVERCIEVLQRELSEDDWKEIIWCEPELDDQIETVRDKFSPAGEADFRELIYRNWFSEDEMAKYLRSEGWIAIRKDGTE